MYPLKFKNTNKVLNKNALTIKAIAESLLFLDDDETLVQNGSLSENSLPDLAEVYMNDLLGDHVYQQYDGVFPSANELLELPNASAVLKLGTDVNAVNNLLDSDSFTINYLMLDRTIKRDYYILDSFVVLYCLDGVGRIISDGKAEIVKAGDVFVIPADLYEIALQPSASLQLLELYIPTHGEEKE